MEQTQFFFRWLHVFAGIVWIGHLYFFNYVNVPLQADLDDATKPNVNPKLLPRALWWFRWGAMVTFLTGIVLYALIYMYDPASGFGLTGLRKPSPWIMMGIAFGFIMWFNVWFIIWPTNRAILRKEITGDALAPARRKAYLASRTNTYLSAPMLFGMLGANHFAFSGAAMGVTTVVGLAVIWVAIFHSTIVGKSA
jgi:uncharacterized membrane protein